MQIGSYGSYQVGRKPSFQGTSPRSMQNILREADNIPYLDLTNISHVNQIAQNTGKEAWKVSQLLAQRPKVKSALAKLGQPYQRSQPTYSSYMPTAPQQTSTSYTYPVPAEPQQSSFASMWANQDQTQVNNFADLNRPQTPPAGGYLQGGSSDVGSSVSQHQQSSSVYSGNTYNQHLGNPGSHTGLSDTFAQTNPYGSTPNPHNQQLTTDYSGPVDGEYWNPGALAQVAPRPRPISRASGHTTASMTNDMVTAISGRLRIQ